MAGSILQVVAMPRPVDFGGGPWTDAWQRLRHGRVAVLCLGVIGILLVLALAAPLLSRYESGDIDWNNFAAAPSLAGGHWFGTDAIGRDLFVRVLSGLRVSLLIAALATLVSVAIGVCWGAFAGYAGGRIDAAMMRIVDVLYSLPYAFFVIALTALFGSSLMLLCIAIGAVSWLTMARIVRGQTLSLRHREFVDAAVISGVATRRILSRHIVPNIIGPIVAYATLLVPQIILLESLMAFLGLGIQEPLSSLGRLIAEGALAMETAPWLLMIPATILVLLLAALSILGDELRDILDPNAMAKRA